MRDNLVSRELRDALDNPRLRHRLAQAVLNRRKEEAVMKNKESNNPATSNDIKWLRMRLESNGFSTSQRTNWHGERSLFFTLKNSNVLYNATKNEISAKLIGPNMKTTISGPVDSKGNILSFIYEMIKHIER